MAEICNKLGCPEVLRLALQDPCTGEPIPGAGNGAAVRCSRNFTLETVQRDAETSEFVSDCGIPDRYVIDAQRQGYNLSFEVSSISPEVEALLNGETLLTDGGVNAGVLYEANGGCVQAAPDPRFIAEAFYKVRQCSSGGTATYLRYVVTGLRFGPAIMDKEGQITYVRFEGTSEPTLLSGLVQGATGGPFEDFPADIFTDLDAVVTANPDYQTPGFWFYDTIDPTSGLTLAANTCYIATVPAAA